MRSPVTKSPRISQLFGENPDIYKRFGLNGHNGIDYAVNTSTKIYAPIGGKVTQTGNDPQGYGLYVKIENNKWGTVLAHLQSYRVTLSQEIKQGQLIGLSNNTGFSTGPHLHWGVHPFPRKNNGYNGYVDPLEAMKEGDDMNKEEHLESHGVDDSVDQMDLPKQFEKIQGRYHTLTSDLELLRNDFKALSEKLEGGDADESEETDPVEQPSPSWITALRNLISRLVAKIGSRR